jgi:hypothetical protein
MFEEIDSFSIVSIADNDIFVKEVWITLNFAVFSWFFHFVSIGRYDTIKRLYFINEPIKRNNYKIV